MIAQDTTKYGLDLPGAPRLAELLAALAALPFAMIRLLYAYPDTLRDDVLAVMAEHDNICHYLDLPVQHGADRILRAMNRHTTGQEILDTLARIRHYLPDAALRSTVMCGFPGGKARRIFTVCWPFCVKRGLIGWGLSLIRRKQIRRLP